MECILKSVIKDLPVDLYFLEQNIFYKSDGAVYKLNEALEKEIVYESSESFVFEGLSQKGIITRNNTGITVNTFAGEPIFIPLNAEGRKQVRAIAEDKILLRLEEDGKWVLRCIKFDGNEWRSENAKPISASFINGFALVDYFLNGELAYYSTSGECVWSLDCNLVNGSKETKIYSSLISNDEVLFVYLADTNSHRTCSYSIRLSDGQEMGQYPELKGEFIAYNGNIYSANIYKVQRFDVKKNELTLLDFTDILEPHNYAISYGTSTIREGGILYFIDGWGRNTNSFGIIDINKHTLLTMVTIDSEDREETIRYIKVIGNSLYVMSHKNVLRVYEVA
jgi:hypothetical protein